MGPGLHNPARVLNIFLMRHAVGTCGSQVAETWDLCMENTVRKLAYGTLAGGLAALILFRARQLHPFFSKPCRAASPTSAAENDGCVACL